MIQDVSLRVWSLDGQWNIIGVIEHLIAGTIVTNSQNQKMCEDKPLRGLNSKLQTVVVSTEVLMWLWLLPVLVCTTLTKWGCVALSGDMRLLLTLFTLHSSVVARFPETDIPQVKDPGHDLKHHGSVFCWDANHTHGMLREKKEEEKKSC